jgi:hypothetical protein
MTKIPYLAGRDPFLLHDILSVLAKVIISLIHGAMLVALAISSLDVLRLLSSQAAQITCGMLKQ